LEKNKSNKDVSYSSLVNVRWFDGYLEVFECKKVRFGSHLLWLKLSSGKNRHIPLANVRWFSTDPDSKEQVRNEA